jgi:hypothetical protein
MTKKRGKKPAAEAKAPKRRRFVEGLVDGKSMYRSAIDAGYSPAMAKNAGVKIMPGAREEFKRRLTSKIPQAKLIQRIAEGLDAREVKLAQLEGEYTDKRYLVDYSERRRYVELAAKLLGLLVERVELSGSEEGPPPNFNLQVNFVDQIRQIYGLKGPDASGEATEEKAESGIDGTDLTS